MTETRTCQNCKTQFTIAPEDFEFYEKIKVPPPTFCPDCRFQRRMSWRSELNFYSNKCGLCGTDVLSTIHPESGYIVYCRPCYWSDKWNALDYGRDFDFSRPFFEQFSELVKATPTVHLFGFPDNVNSTYVNYAGSLKDCYMYCGGRWGENMYYIWFGVRNKDCSDMAIAYDCELCYECVDASNCYNVRYSEYVRNCNDCTFLFNSTNCQNCFCSTNLNNASHVFCNEKLTKAQYEESMKQVRLSSYQEIEKWKTKFEIMKRNTLRKFSFTINSEHCTGDYFKNSKNCVNCYTAIESENVRHSQIFTNMRDSMDLSQSGFNGELCYEISTGGNAGYNCGVGVVVRDCRDTWYAYVCHNSSNIFGCANLWKYEYCIFNKKYSKEEYEKLCAKIVAHMKETGEWGEFFPTQFSPYAYNESAAPDFFPLTKEEVIARGWRWQDRMPEARGKETIGWDKVPDDVHDISDSICKEVLACTETGKNYKIIKQELDFYKRMSIPIPRFCPDMRRLRRLHLRNPRKLWSRQCRCDRTTHGHGIACSKTFETTYAPDRPELVYCEQCYQAEVV